MTIDAIDARTRALGAPRSALLPFQIAGAIDVMLGLDLLAFGGTAAALFLPGATDVVGMDPALFVRMLGAALLLVGIETLAAAQIQQFRRFLPAVVAMTWACAAASVAAMALWHGPLSAIGIAFLAVMAAAAATLALAQGRALRQSDVR